MDNAIVSPLLNYQRIVADLDQKLLRARVAVLVVRQLAAQRNPDPKDVITVRHWIESGL